MSDKKCLVCKRTIVGKSKFGLCQDCYSKVKGLAETGVLGLTIFGVKKAIPLIKSVIKK